MNSDASNKTLGQQYTLLADLGESYRMEFASSSDGKVFQMVPSSEFVTSSERNRMPCYFSKRNASEGCTNCHSDESSTINDRLGSVSLGWTVESHNDFQSKGGAQPTSEVHNFSNVDKYPSIPPEEYPADFKESQYDCVLIYSDTESDRKKALHFKDIVENNIKLEDGTCPMVCILDRGDNLPHIQSRFKHAEEALERSTYMFLLLTKDFVNDAWAEMQKDECLMLSLTEPDKKWCVVPLITKRKQDMDFKCPYGLRALKGLNIYSMLKGKDIEEIDPAKIGSDDLDQFFVKNLTKMFNFRLCDKRERERQQNFKLEEWIRREQKRRLEKQLEEELRNKRHKMEQEKMINEIKNGLYSCELFDSSRDDTSERPESRVLSKSGNDKSDKDRLIINNYGNIQFGGSNVLKTYQAPMSNSDDSTCSSIYSTEDNTAVGVDDTFTETPEKCLNIRNISHNPETVVKKL